MIDCPKISVYIQIDLIQWFCFLRPFFHFNSDDDQILIQTDSIGDGMIDAVEEIIDENPRPSPSAIIVLVSAWLYFGQNILEKHHH